MLLEFGVARVIALAAAVALTALQPPITFAQDNQSQTHPNKSVRAQVKQTLESAGFTEVEVMPDSFLVRAKDSAGSPVMMVINPDFFTAFTELENQKRNDSNSRNTTTSQGQQPDQTVDNQKIPDRANGSLAETKEDYKPSLTTAQKQEIWQTLSSVTAAKANEPKDFSPQVGATIPSGVPVQPLPGEITNNAPSLKGYEYTMLQSEIVIVHPTSKKIVVHIIKEQ